jgi:hypothetical protein
MTPFSESSSSHSTAASTVAQNASSLLHHNPSYKRRARRLTARPLGGPYSVEALKRPRLASSAEQGSEQPSGNRQVRDLLHVTML